MKIWYGVDNCDPDFGPCVVTIGFFDGVHRGHQDLIAAAAKRAQQLELPLMLVTFDPHPLQVVAPHAMPPLLGTVESRSRYAEEFGVDAVCALSFTPEMAAMSPAEFFSTIIVDGLQAATVFVGSNFTFGHKAQGTTETLRDLGRAYDVEIVVHDLLVDDCGETVCSTKIRSLLAEGDVAKAAELLGRFYAVSSTVERGAGRGGRELGYPTANLYFGDSVALPADGVYCGFFTIDDEDEVDGSMVPHVPYMTAISVGTNPTFGDERRSVEAFVLDREADLYGREVTVRFVERIRGMEKFDGIDELLSAMSRDVRKTREILQRIDLDENPLSEDELSDDPIDC